MPDHKSSRDFRRKLRPRKIGHAVRRRWFEYQLERTPRRHDVPTIELGSKYGSWIVPSAAIGADWLCYCVGAGGDVSFDLKLIQCFGATVRAFDPVAGYVEEAIAEAAGESRFSAHRAAIATRDGPLRMQVTHDERSRSVSPAGLYDSSSFVELPGRTIASLMAELGDEHIDLLKLDVEGGEYELLPTLDLNALGVKVFAVQLHHTGSVGAARRLIARLGDAGYDAVGCVSVVKLTFVRRDVIENTRA